jgi:DNA mismatch repair protein PMS2
VDINVSPDKRTLFLHAEQNLLESLKSALEERFAPSRSTFNVNGTQTPAPSLTLTQAILPFAQTLTPSATPTPTQRADPQGAESRPTAAPDVVSATQSRKIQTHTLLDEEVEEASSQSISSRTQPSIPEEPDVDESFGSAPLLSDRSSDGPSFSIDTNAATPLTPSTSTSSPAPALNDSTVICRSWGRSFALDSSSATSYSSPLPRSRMSSSSLPLSAKEDQRPSEPLSIHNSDEEEDDKPRDAARKERSPEVVMSTQNASWARNRSPSLSPDAEERKAAKYLRRSSITSENMDHEDVAVGPRSSPSPTPALSKRPSAPLSPKKERDAKRAKTNARPVETKKTLRSMLASFAAPGSQLPPKSDDEDMEGMSEGGEPNEGFQSVPEEEVLPARPPLAPSHVRGRSSSSGVVNPTHDVDMDDIPTEPSTPNVSQVEETAEIVRTKDDEASVLSFDLEHVRRRWSRLNSPLSSDTVPSPASSPSAAQAASLTASSSSADAALSRMITKSDFASMSILGQFNLGFIITQLSQDLWIVDQHAADEKYNFEDLQRNTKIQSQRLVRPRPLELSAADEMVARENVDVLKQNGFEIDVGEDGEEEEGNEDGEGGEEGRRRGLHLVAQPISKNTVFDMHGELHMSLGLYIL